MNYNTSILTDALHKININLSDLQINQLIRYYELLVEKNKVMNLTAITEYEDVMIKHFVDSISLVNAYSVDNLNKGIKVLDMGTGAGFPGIPLKIVFPDINIILVDSLAKRVKFLDEVINELNLNENGSISAIHSRAEDYIKQTGIRESFDLVVSRAVANLSTLSEYCIPYVKLGGYFIPYKSEKADEELESATKAISVLGGDVEDTCSFSLPGMENNKRTMIVIKKTRNTKNIYPRKAGLPSKDPL